MSCAGGVLKLPWPVIPLDGYVFLTVFLPAHVAYYSAALLVTFPKTYFLRLALLPLWLFLLSRLVIIDMTDGDLERDAENMGIMAWGTIMFLRCISFSFSATHYTRTGKNRDPLKSRTISQILWDAGDLCFNLRGVGWDVTKRYMSIERVHDLPLTQPARKYAFVRKLAYQYATFVLLFETSWAAYKFLFDASITDTITSPFLLHFARTSIYPFSVFASMQGSYVIESFFGVVVFGQDPDEWLPFMNAPWRSTSLSEFWGYRWHQALRDTFGHTGGRFFGLFFGKAGHVIGAFIASAVYHDAVFWGMQRATGMCCHIGGFFVLAGVGIVLETLFQKTTGMRPGGIIGWLWTMGWCYTTLMFWLDEVCMERLFQAIKVNYTMRPISTMLGI